MQEVVEGKHPGRSIIHKFGFATITNSLAPITQTLTYFTPLTPVNLEFVSDDVADATGGSGATKITIEIIDPNWDQVTHVIDTDGVTPVPLPPMLRLCRWYVSESGSYASPISPSYVGNLTIRVLGGGTAWDIIKNGAPFPAQSEIGVYSAPRGHSLYLYSKSVFVDANKPIDIFFMFRQNTDDITAPFSGVRRLIEREIGIIGDYTKKWDYPKGPFVGPCDIGFQGIKQSSGTADVSVEYVLLQVKDGF
jgi:hypothetical protein